MIKEKLQKKNKDYFVARACACMYVYSKYIFHNQFTIT